MPEVDFYILREAGDAAMLRIACRITEKAWLAGHRIHVLTRDEDQTARMDDLLWTFRQESFLAHERWDGRGDPGARVTLGCASDLEPVPEILVNLGADVPDWFRSCARVAEIVAGDAPCKAAGRRRYREYREAQAPLRTHEV
jgi:DNA polymerase-3 subunit chi